MKEKEKPDFDIQKYEEYYNKAFLKITKSKNDGLEFQDILGALIVSQESYSNKTRDIRNIFFTNSLNKAGIIHFDKGLPEKIKLWEYYTILSDPDEKYFENNEIFKDHDQLKRFFVAFINRFFKGGVEEYSFFDKIIFNTLIKSKMIKRYDSSFEDIETTAKAFFSSSII